MSAGTDSYQDQVAHRAGAFMSEQGYHWSEAIVRAVGEHLWGQVEDQLQRATVGLSGGVGGTHEEMCGALSGGVLIIGALHGRVLPDEDDSYCRALSARYRERFAQEIGTTRCADLRESTYGSDKEWPCSVLVERATRVLLEVLRDGEGPSVV